jgi:hypothetical protein
LDKNYYPSEYLFNLIETLLPRANLTKNGEFKMVEIWGRKDVYRKGWVHFVEKS